MKQAGKTLLHRCVAMLLSLVLTMGMFVFPASAQEDWKDLVITLSWMEGDVPMSVQAVPQGAVANLRFIRSLP